MRYNDSVREVTNTNHRNPLFRDICGIESLLGGVKGVTSLKNMRFHDYDENHAVSQCHVLPGTCEVYTLNNHCLFKHNYYTSTVNWADFEVRRMAGEKRK